MVSDALLEEVRSRADLVEICGEHTSLKRVGKSYRGPCPLHGGDGPNFSVDPAKGLFKCFVCGEGGDVFSFVMKYLGLDFPSAVRHVAQRVGIDIPDPSERREDPYRHLREATAFAEEWFADQLRAAAGRGARAYLESRGIDLELAERFALGYAPDAWRALRETALAHGIEETHLLEVGLTATSERAEEPYDRFRDRLIFSIRDMQDRPLGFGGRTLGERDEKIPKYINSPDSPIFHKRKLLYGLNWARHAIRRDGRAAIVEGYTDVLSLHRNDVPIAVAGLGTSFTAEQAERLGRYAKRAYLMYDSDDAGLRATFKAADALLRAGVHPMIVTLPEGEDPDSLVRRQGAAALSGYLEDAVDVLERKLQILEREGYLERVEGRRRAVDGVLSTLRAAKDPALRDIYLDRAAERIGVRRETLVHEIARGEEIRRSRRRVAGPGAAVATPPAVERNLLLLLLRDPGLVGRASDAGVTVEHFRHPGLAALYETLVKAHGEGQPDDWMRRVPSDRRDLVERLLGDETELTDSMEIFEESVKRVLHRSRLERLTEIDRELELADETQARELLVEKQTIAAELRGAGFPLSFLRKRGQREASAGTTPTA